ncbi:MAG TPA: dihydrolipoamide acetyltransferase family protein [Candidatus Dormibacteraeota bacterium]|nr:dihydrolipoamide acetyltransferase family protein [Candidatus Dormibacteraeota bacterium]
MPQMGYDMTEGSINRWLVEEGATVQRGDVIASIATEKADIDIEAYASGVLRKILVQPGATVPVGEPIAIIADAEEELQVDPKPRLGAPAAEAPAEPEPTPAEPLPGESGDQAEAPPSDEAAVAKPGPTPVPDWAQQLSGHSQEPLPAGRSLAPGERVRASPLARRRARELGIALETVRPSGPEGRIKAEDVEVASRGGAAPRTARQPGAAPPLDLGDPSEPLPLSRMREAIARRMAESNNTIPHFHLTTEANMGSLLELRREMNQLADPALPKFSVTDFVVRAMALALQRHPSINAAWVGQGVRRFSQSNVALAVALPDGLVAPVIRGCEALPFAELSRQTHDLAARAKSGRLRPEELSGGHTAISNLGMFGVSQFSAIITPGQGSVLAVGEVRPVPVVVDGEVLAGQQMAMTLAIDHRVTDGAQGAEALAYLRWLLEHPTACLL